MATTTYITLEQALASLLNFRKNGTTTSAGGASGATLISTDLNQWDGAKDDFYNRMWAKITSGVDTGCSRYIGDYATATGTVTPRSAFVVVATGVATQVASGVTFETYPFEPALMLSCFQRAADLCYPTLNRKGLFRQVFDESNTTNNWAWNGHFEDWTATTIPDHWALNGGGTATISESTTATLIRGPKGSSSVKMVGGGDTDYILQSGQAQNPSLFDLQGHTIIFYVYAFAAAASKARLTIAYGQAGDAAVTTASSSYHTGNSNFELLQKEVTLPEDLTDIEIRLESGGSTVYFDNLFMRGAPACYRYHLSKDFVHEPKHIWVQGNDATGTDNYGATMVQGGEQWAPLPKGQWGIEDNGTDRFLSFNSNAYLRADARKIKLMGIEPLSSPTADTSTVEVSGETVRPLVAMAAAELFASLAGTANAPDNQVIDYQKRAEFWRNEAERLLNTFGMPMPYNVLRMTTN